MTRFFPSASDRDELATKADLAALETRMTATLYRALRFQGGAVIAILNRASVPADLTMRPEHDFSGENEA